MRLRVGPAITHFSRSTQRHQQRNRAAMRYLPSGRSCLTHHYHSLSAIKRCFHCGITAAKLPFWCVDELPLQWDAVGSVHSDVHWSVCRRCALGCGTRRRSSGTRSPTSLGSSRYAPAALHWVVCALYTSVLKPTLRFFVRPPAPAPCSTTRPFQPSEPQSRTLLSMKWWVSSAAWPLLEAVSFSFRVVSQAGVCQTGVRHAHTHASLTAALFRFVTRLQRLWVRSDRLSALNSSRSTRNRPPSHCRRCL
jgi:hypothetical protein